MGFHNINYIVVSDLIMIWHCIYKERDEISFMRIKSVHLIFNILVILFHGILHLNSLQEK
jgi:hypothetical protein